VSETFEPSQLLGRSPQAEAFDRVPVGMALARTDRAALGEITEANAALCRLTGLAREELVGRRLAELHHPDDRAAAAENAKLLSGDDVSGYGGEQRWLRPDGDTVWVRLRAARLTDAHTPPQVVLEVQDVTERRRSESRLRYLADHDPLTGLFNRRRFVEEVAWVTAYSRRYRSPAAVIVVGIDTFKFVNDTFGHGVGDELLAAIAETLRQRSRETDILGRLGGDEFGVILPQSSEEEAQLVASSLLDAIRVQAHVRVGPRTVRARASLGVRMIEPETRLSAEELLSEADIALYDAKEAGRDRMSVVLRGGEVTDRLRRRMHWADRIRDALAHERFVLYEQPILGLESGRIEGSELLLRMLDDDGTPIAPGAFLEVAERFGQIQAIDRWVIGQAVRLLGDRQAAGIDLDLEVNISGGSITEGELVDSIVAEVRGAPIDPSRLTFELTETAAIVNMDRAKLVAQRLADLGCRFALDDFGAGFGSFYYLKHLPFDVVKIDGEFIRELLHRPADRLTVEAIVHIADGLDKPVIAEFVQDAATLALLRDLGVGYAQGYHVGRPQPVSLRPGFLDAQV
jgi:diguanylate cyclase (GGDEF)-like protein/PAS domain S-box-containing protein